MSKSQTQPPPLEIHLEAKTWNDLSKSQCIQVFHLLTEGSAPGLYFPLLNIMQRLRAFFYLAQLPPHIIEEWQRSDELSAEDAIDGETTFAFTLHEACAAVLEHLVEQDEEQPTRHRLIFARTKPIWPELKVKTSKKVESWYAPAEAWENLTILEMAHAFTLLQNYDEDKDPTHLHRLFSTLYRPSKPPTPHNLDTNYQDDRRIPYREHGEYSIERRLPHFAKLKPEVLNLMLFWAMSCRSAIIEAYPRVFKPKNPTDAERHPNDYGWGGVLLSIADGVVYLDKVADQNCHTVLAYLSKLEDERLEREMWEK